MSVTEIIVDTKKVAISIELIKKYVKGFDVSLVIQVLEELLKTPQDPSLRIKLSDSLQPLGVGQGTVLSYAPYISVLISENLFDDE